MKDGHLRSWVLNQEHDVWHIIGRVLKSRSWKKVTTGQQEIRGGVGGGGAGWDHQCKCELSLEDSGWNIIIPGLKKSPIRNELMMVLLITRKTFWKYNPASARIHKMYQTWNVMEGLLCFQWNWWISRSLVWKMVF